MLLNKLATGWRVISSRARMKPSFMLIGTQKGGTTSLFNYLIQHPNILAPLTKELHYFDLKEDKGNNWYHQYFPLRTNSKNQLTGEASPFYLFHPYVPQKIKTYNAGLKFIVLLRDPVLRAFSQYNMAVKNAYESRSFTQAYQEEMELLEKHNFGMEAIYKEDPFRFQKTLYLSRGLYNDQLKRWFALFDPKQFLILDSHSFFNQTQETFTKALNFLDLQGGEEVVFSHLNKGKYSKIAAEDQQRLYTFYEKHNRELFDLIGKEFKWEQQ